MQVHGIQSRVGETAADAVVVGVFEDAPLAGAAAEVDAALGGAIRSLLERKEFTGRRYELVPLLVPMGLAKQTLVVGLDRKEAFDAGMAFRTAGAAAKQLSAKPRSQVNFYLDDGWAEEWTDLATLTGACVVALGTETAGAMTNNQPWCDTVLAAANRAGEPLWQLPMNKEIYDELIKSEVADIKNVGEGRWGGAITAAKFLEQFVGNTPWTHLDIAGPAFRDKAKPWCDAGASGQFVRTLVELARSEAGGKSG